MEQFIDDEAEDLRHGFTHFRTGILGRQQLGQADQLVQGLAGPLIVQLPFAAHEVQFFFWIINEGQEIILLFLRHRMVKEHFYFFPDNAGAIIQNMIKGIIFPVKVTHEMFRPLRQVNDSLQVNDFRKRRCLRRIFLR